MNQKSRNILVLRYRFIGDTVLTVPFLRNLRRAEPGADITWLVAPGSSDVLKGIPYVNRMLYWDPETIHADSRGTHRTFSAKIAFIRHLRRMQFDKAYVLKRSLSSALIAWLSGARERIGFDTEGRGLLLTTRVPYRHDRHEVENFLEVLRRDNIPVIDDHLEIWTAPEEERAVAGKLRDAGIGESDRIAVIHPFSAVVERGWAFENFGELCARLAAAGYKVIITGGGERDQRTFKAMQGVFGKAVIDFVGRCTLPETVALLKRSSLFVGNDSGIMHLAAAAGTPLVALFGPQSPVKFGPWSRRATVIYKGMSCSPCRQKFFTECSPSPRMRPECVETISVDEVFEACRAAGRIASATTTTDIKNS